MTGALLTEPEERAAEPSQNRIGEFWDRNPVNADFFDAERSLDRGFFEDYDRRRRATEGHIRGELAKIPLEGKRVLEIGLGHGTESQLLAERAGQYVGVDLTRESLRRVRRRFDVFGLERPALGRSAGERLPFADDSFDVVFSHGVIHHSPRIAEIVAELHRVLKPGGRAVVMVYHRASLNYHLSIRVFRRLGIFLLALPGFSALVARATGEPLERLTAHTESLRRRGLGYLRMESFIHASTDGPHNVFSSVWSREEAAVLFGGFTSVRTSVHYLNERHLPGVRFLPSGLRESMARRWGWHLWIDAEK
jgi:ubiquinone/menaquinone biosynthesis C-methylase UbiE